MSERFARAMLFLHVLALLLGTLMPGSWRANVEQSLSAPMGLSSLAHFILFASMACLLCARPLAWQLTNIVIFTLTFALLSEGLQFFAIDRHPRWIDIGIDMAGACAGLGLSRLLFIDDFFNNKSDEY